MKSCSSVCNRERDKVKENMFMDRWIRPYIWANEHLQICLCTKETSVKYQTLNLSSYWITITNNEKSCTVLFITLSSITNNLPWLFHSFTGNKLLHSFHFHTHGWSNIWLRASWWGYAIVENFGWKLGWQQWLYMKGNKTKWALGMGLLHYFHQ